MSPWIQGPQGGAAPPPHVCSPPRRWPWLSRRRHPSGSVWECEFVVLSGVRGEAQGFCGRRWRLEWWASPPLDVPYAGRRLWDATWTEVTSVGEGGASSE